MSAARHVLAISIGPVQEFIEQARRTRDLWYASHLLSEMCKAAARALRPFAERDAQGVVFPALDDERHWEPCEQPLRADGSPPVNVSNRLLVVLTPSADPRAAALTAREAARAHLAETARGVRDKFRVSRLVARDIDPVWDEQIATHLEFAAAWHAFDDEHGYRAARHEAETALAGRKALREFVPWRHSRAGAPKSSLDGARESVLAEPDPGNENQAAARRRLRLSRGEQLDALGLVKRGGGEPEQFVPLANIALAAWIEEARRRNGRALDDLITACEHTGLQHIHRPDLPWVKSFPFDAHVFLQARWGPLFEELGRTAKEGDGWGRSHVTPVFAKGEAAMPAPSPYVACLVADGDHMGRALDAATTPAQHRALSQALARFAAQARDIVEGTRARADGRRGVLVYSGGDDVLAFVCLPDALRCARALHDAFEQCLTGAVADAPPPTLSVGLGVGHLMDEMGHLLRLARAAERYAKGRTGEGDGRDSLAILVEKRAGSEARWRAKWGDDPVGRLQRDVELLRGRRLTTGKLFEVRDIWRRMPPPRDVDPHDDEAWRRLLADDVRRTLRRTEGRGMTRLSDAQIDTEFGLALDGDTYARTHEAVQRWVERLRAARTLATAQVPARVAREQPV